MERDQNPNSVSWGPGLSQVWSSSHASASSLHELINPNILWKMLFLLKLVWVYFLSLVSDTYLTHWWRQHSLVEFNICVMHLKSEPPCCPWILRMPSSRSPWLVFWSTHSRFLEERRLYRSERLTIEQTDGAQQGHSVASTHNPPF